MNKKYTFKRSNFKILDREKNWKKDKPNKQQIKEHTKINKVEKVGKSVC